MCALLESTQIPESSDVLVPLSMHDIAFSYYNGHMDKLYCTLLRPFADHLRKYEATLEIENKVMLEKLDTFHNTFVVTTDGGEPDWTVDGTLWKTVKEFVNSL